MIDIFNKMFNMAQSLETCAHARILAVITHHNKSHFLEEGRNQYKTHPFQKRFSTNEDCIYLHAEIDCIKNALRWMSVYDLQDCDLYVMRLKQETKAGPTITGLSRPCKGCMRAIATFGIKNVYYTEDKKSEFTCL
jgi:tRNA(Arg) A34 adenosine deaminase TadA